MKKKTITNTIFLFIIPLIIYIIIAITYKKSDNLGYDSLDIPTYQTINIDSIGNNNIYIYFTVFLMVIITSIIWYYIKKKKNF